MHTCRWLNKFVEIKKKNLRNIKKRACQTLHSSGNLFEYVKHIYLLKFSNLKMSILKMHFLNWHVHGFSIEWKLKQTKSTTKMSIPTKEIQNQMENCMKMTSQVRYILAECDSKCNDFSPVLFLAFHLLKLKSKTLKACNGNYFRIFFPFSIFPLKISTLWIVGFLIFSSFVYFSCSLL